jgi:hypothetical protein
MCGMPADVVRGCVVDPWWCMALTSCTLPTDPSRHKKSTFAQHLFEVGMTR